ncbi:MAG: Sec-independent protein translocase subunit TatA/TatB [Acidimicrobiales bacterium]
MGFLDPGKILVVLVLALLVLGPERLPRAARQAGTAWRELTRIKEQVTDEIRSALPEDMPSIPRMPNNMVSGFISDLTKAGPRTTGPGAAGEGSEPQPGTASPAARGAASVEGTASVPGTSSRGEATSRRGGRSSSWGAPAQPGSAAQGSDRVPDRPAGQAPLAVVVAADDPSMN